MSFETYDHIILWLLIFTAPAATIFPLLYGFTSRWWETLIGRGLLVKSIAVAMLIDFSLLTRKVELTVGQGMALGMTLMVLITVGVNLQCLALIRQKWPVFCDWLRRRNAPPVA